MRLIFTAGLLHLHKRQFQFQLPDLLVTVALKLPTFISPRISRTGIAPSSSRPLGTRDEVLGPRCEGHCRVGVLPDLIPRRQNTIRIVWYVIDTADVVVKMRARLSHTVEMLGLEQRPLEILASLHLVELPIRERQRRLEGVFNLPAIPAAGRFFFVVEPVVFGEFADLVL